MRRSQAGLTLAELAAGITVLGVVVALLVPAFTHGRRFEKLLLCQNHLHALYGAQARASAPGPGEFGRAYWIRLAATRPPLISADVLRCPFVEAPEAPPCQYFGPAPDFAAHDEKTPLGCDMELSHSEDGHEGGNVLLKSGEVLTDNTGVWGSAHRQGKCRP